MVNAIWSILTFPFRLIGSLVAVVGRAVGLVIGFVLMAAGVAFSAGTLIVVGLPLFIIGLLVTLKALG